MSHNKIYNKICCDERQSKLCLVCFTFICTEIGRPLILSCQMMHLSSMMRQLNNIFVLVIIAFFLMPGLDNCFLLNARSRR